MGEAAVDVVHEATNRPWRAALASVVAAGLTLVLLSSTVPSARAVTGDAEPSLEDTIAARQHFFGAENVDPETGAVPRDEVHLSWVSVATFAVAMDGHVLLFDAYIHKEEEQRNYVPATTQDLLDLDPEYIVLGHGHFDHALEAGRIAAATGATVVGTEHHCQDQAAISGEEFDCRAIFDDGAAFGDTVAVDLWDGVCTTAVLHVHSAEEPPDPDHDPTNTVVPVPDASNVLLHPPGSAFGTDGDEGGTVLYQFRIGNFSLTYHDSVGPLPERAPEVFPVLEGLPNTDVEVGAILGFNQITNGLRDPALYAAAIDPQVYVPSHHDFVTEYGSADEFEPVLLREFEDYGVETELRFLYDPYDYVRPNLLRFDIDAPRWAESGDEVCPRPAGTGDVAISAAPDPDEGVGGLAATGGALGLVAFALLGMAGLLHHRDRTA